MGNGVALEEDADNHDDRIVVSGYGMEFGDNRDEDGYLVARFNPDGTVDDTCGFPPYRVTDFAKSYGRANHVLVQRGGEIVVGGEETILRFEGGGPSLFNKVSVLDATPIPVAEPTSGSTPATFKVRLDQPSCEPVSVDWTTAEDPGAPDAARAGSDYTPRSGTVTFASKDTSETVEVPVLGDTVPEGAERFFVDLSNPRVGALASLADVRPRDLVSSPVTLGDPRATATIGDAGPAVSVSDPTVAEPDSGTVPAAFVVSLNGATDHDVTVDYTTEDRSARASTATDPGDYTARSDKVTIPAGKVSETVEVAVVGDTAPEDTEQFVMRLTQAAGAALADAEGAATILDDDTAAKPDPTLSVGDARVSEGDADSPATLTVSLNRAPGRDVSVDYTTVPGSAEAGTDYLRASRTLAFGPNEQAKTVAVTIVGDQVPEPTEQLFLQLANPRGAVLARAQGVITIDDDDGPPPPPPEEEIVTTTERRAEAPPDPVRRAPLVPAPSAPPAPLPLPGPLTASGPLAASAPLAALPPLSNTAGPAAGLSLPPIPPPPPLLQLPAPQPAGSTQAQIQQQTQVQHQAQVQQQAQAAAQAAFLAQRERQAEVEGARTDRRDANPEYLASSRQRSPVPAPALAWVGSLVAMGLSTVFARNRRSAPAPVRAPYRPRRRR